LRRAATIGVLALPAYSAVAVDHRDRVRRAAMGLKAQGRGDFPAAANSTNSLLVLPRSLIRREKFADSLHREFGRNRPILRFFPMPLKAKFPANCKNSLQIPAYQGIWM
jgi:hypothetical protein